MKLVNVTKETEKTFFCCLHEELPEYREHTEIRRRWYEKYRKKGFRAKLLFENKKIIGLCQYIPIEFSHLIGKKLLAILCFYVHGYEHGVGNKQGKGFGRFMLNSIEADARESGFKGVAVWGIDWEINWMPVSFFEHMGYTRADSEDKVVVLWKSFSGDAEPPSLKRLKVHPSRGDKKVNVFVAANGWCGCEKFLDARKAVDGLEDIVEYEEFESPECATILHVGYVGGIFLDGKPFKPYEPPGFHEELRAEIIRLYEKKTKK